VAQITLPNGKRKVKYSKVQKIVKDWLLEQRKAVKDQIWIGDETVTLSDFFARYMTDVAVHKLRPKTLEAYESLIRIHILPEIGNIKLSRLTPGQLQSLYSLKRNQGLSPRTVQFIHSIIHKALEQALKWGVVARNVSDLVDKPTVKRKAPTVWNIDQVQQFLSYVQDDRLYPLYLLAVSTGMREGELLALHWEDVDFSSGTISVRRSLQQLKGKGLVISEPKSEKSKRLISVPAFVLEKLKPYKSTGLMFKTINKTPFSPRNLVREFKKHAKNAGLPEIRFHDLRHTAATLMLSAGIHPKVVQEMLGHSQISLTLDTYSHVLPTLQNEAAEKMDELMRI
jgi:integrase